MPSVSKPSKTAAPRRKTEADNRKIPSFGRSLPMLLMNAREAVMQRFRPHLRSHDITEQQWRILRVLAEQKNADMLELSVRCRIHPPSLSRTIPLLAQRRLVRRFSDSGDQRRVLVGLTSHGRALFSKMSVESAAIYAQLEAKIGAVRLAKIYRVLDDLIAVISLQEESGEDN
jgi:homoprotocatechuate degradation regulator HpaR